MLHKATSKAAIMNMIAARAGLIGLQCPSEPTIRRMLGLVAWLCRQHHLGQETLLQDRDQFKLFLRTKSNKQQSASLPYIIEYPTAASGLPEAIVKHAYGDAGAPPEVQIPELHSILAGTKMRGAKQLPDWMKAVPEHLRPLLLATHRASPTPGVSPTTPPLSQAHFGGVTPLPLPPSSSGCGISGSLPLSPPQAVFGEQGFQEPRLPPTSGPTPSGAADPAKMQASSVSMFRNTRGLRPLFKLTKKSKDPKLVPVGEASPDGPAAAVPGCDPEVGVEEDTVAQMEAAMLDALNKKKGGTHKASKDKDKETAPKDDAPKDVKKREERVVPMKRPAAAVEAGKKLVDMADVFKKLKVDIAAGSVSRGASSSRAYDSAMRRANAIGMKAEDAREFARAQFAHANKLYDAKYS